MSFPSIPHRIKWITSVVLVFVLTMSLLRVIFYWGYQARASVSVLPAFVMGLRYDLKFASILGLFLLLITSIKLINPFRKQYIVSFWNIFLSLVWVILLFLYVADYFHFDYLHERLNASVLNYLEDASISAGMVAQSYPIWPVIIALSLLSVISFILFRRLLNYFMIQPPVAKFNGVFFTVHFLLLGSLVFGKVGQFNLRWSDAFTLGNDFSANLALNPLQSFFSTLSFKNSTADINKVREGYPLMAAHFGLTNTDPQNLSLERSWAPTDSPLGKPNIVLVICESFSAYKSSAFGNALHTTPFFDSIASKGIFFDRCFTPAYGTARGVWATITGIPDVEQPRTASRNPAAVNQRTIINDFTGYEKMYFLGGNPAWANIQGLLSNNIKDLHLYMQYDFKAPKVDVWGISDKNLFLEANGILKKQTKPFFAIIQTADNHRPYTIPEEDRDEFKMIHTSADSLKRSGFESIAELNAFRYTDFSFRKFMEAAVKEPYFKNTLFVFVGDHGIPGDAGKMFPNSWTENKLTCEHVPLLFYAPSWLQPSRESQICSQVDVLPSTAALAKVPYTNTALGRNIFEPIPESRQTAFIFDVDRNTIGMVGEGNYYYKNLKSKKEDFVSVTSNNKSGSGSDSIRNRLAKMTDAWHETAKYLLIHNKRP